jgi:hypothetical protein
METENNELRQETKKLTKDGDTKQEKRREGEKGNGKGKGKGKGQGNGQTMGGSRSRSINREKEENGIRWVRIVANSIHRLLSLSSLSFSPSPSLSSFVCFLFNRHVLLFLLFLDLLDHLLPLVLLVLHVLHDPHVHLQLASW